MSKQLIDLSDRGNNVYFDTSIYNRLLDDGNRIEILKAVRNERLIIVPSIVNLCEMLLTRDEGRRTALIQLYHDLRNDFHPLKPDLWLLKECIEAFTRGTQALEINYPIAATDETRDVCSEIRNVSRGGLNASLEAARGFIQSIALRERLATEGQYFEYLDSEHGLHVLRDILISLSNALGCRETVTDQVARDLVRSPMMPWKYFLESIAYLYYRRAFPHEGFGRNANPGEMDLMQCAYLFWPRRFVIQDGPFFTFLKQLGALRSYRVDIFDYDEFIRQLDRE